MRVLARRIVSLALGVCSFAALGAGNAWGFPPYRSTDAGTAAPGNLEVRLGLLGVERMDGDTAYGSPLLRMNLGLPKNLELISEFEFRADQGRFSDGALGFKWVPFRGSWSFGLETLVLLPVGAKQKGSGVESQLLATFQRKNLQLHLNAGGFYDARRNNNQRGWRAGSLGEIQMGRFRPGLELFAKQVLSENVQVQAGAGVIVDFGLFDVRTGVHAGLTRAAPDFTTSLWLTIRWPLW